VFGGGSGGGGGGGGVTPHVPIVPPPPVSLVFDLISELVVTPAVAYVLSYT